MSHTVRDLLPVRQYVYHALHIIFGQNPTEAIVTALLSKESLETLQALNEDPTSGYALAVEGFKGLEEEYLDAVDKAQTFKKLSLEYTRLFVGPNAIPAPPWEMVYKTGKRELFQPGVLKLRELYQSVGCKPAESPHVSDDHLGIELDFMRFLCEKTIVALEQGDEEAAVQLEALQLRFLQEHHAEWVPQFLEDFEPATQESFYVNSAELLGAFIKQEVALLQG